MTTMQLPAAVDATPPPLEFLTDDFIHPENEKIREREDQRWRLLSPLARIRLQRETVALARQLRKAHYNQLVLELDELRQESRKLKPLYRVAEDRATKLAYRKQLQALFDQARPIAKQLHELKPTYELYKHYAGWLDYEAKNRAALKAEARREKEIERKMNQEAKFLEQIIKSVWRETNGCHYTLYENDSKKRTTKIPKFAKSVIRPDAHYFYIMATRRVLLGYKWMLPHDVTIKRLTEEDVILNLNAATKREVVADWTETGQLFYRVSRLDSPDALPKEVPWRKAMEYYPEKQTLDLPYCIGVKEARKYVWFNFAKEPHMLVAGKTQSGKSNLVNGIIASLVSTHSPSELRIVLIDQKGGIEFTHWHDVPHLYGKVIKTVEEVEPTFDNIIRIMKNREKLLTAVKAKGIADYNKRVDADAQLPRLIIILDEMINLIGHGELTKRIHIKMGQITGLGRATGIHFIASTQHPEVKVIPGIIKTNMSVRLSGSMPNHHASELVIDCADAARLPSIAGRFIGVVGMDKITVQVPHITDDDIYGVVSSTKLAYPDVPEKLVDEHAQTSLVIWNAQRCLEYSIEYLDGALSAQKLDKLVGTDGLGEWEFKKLYKQLINEATVNGQPIKPLIRESDGTLWMVEKVKRGYYVKEQSEQSEETTPPVMLESASD